MLAPGEIIECSCLAWALPQHGGDLRGSTPLMDFVVTLTKTPTREIPESRAFTRVALHRKTRVQSSLASLSLTEFSCLEGAVTERPSFSTASLGKQIFDYAAQSIGVDPLPPTGWCLASSRFVTGRDLTSCLICLSVCLKLPGRLNGALGQTRPLKTPWQCGIAHRTC